MRMRIIVGWLSLSCLAASANDFKSCSQAALTGSYGFSVSGTNITANVAFAVVGIFVADGKGRFRGSGTETVAGRIHRTTFDGEYNVQGDCSGTAKLTFARGDKATLEFVIVSDGAELLILDSDAGVVETGAAKRQHRAARRVEAFSPKKS